MTKNSATTGRLLGYARVSTEDQATAAQEDELRAAGCAEIFREHASGASRARPELERLLTAIQPGDVLVVVRLDRLARSVAHLVEVIERLGRRGSHFRSLRDPIDTSSPQGMFTLHVLGAVAQLERALISERTKAGLKAAKARGRVGGNPGLRAKDPDAIRRSVRARDQIHVTKLIEGMESFMPIVRRLRPATPWEKVTAAVNREARTDWTVERLRRAVGRLVAEGLASRELLKAAPRREVKDNRLARLVGGIALANPELTTRDICAQLERMGERTPRGATSWHPSTVWKLIERYNTSHP